MKVEYKLSMVDVTEAMTYRMTHQMTETATMYENANLMMVGMTKNSSQMLKLDVPWIMRTNTVLQKKTFLILMTGLTVLKTSSRLVLS